MTEVTNPYDCSVFYLCVSSGQDLTRRPPAFVMSRASHAARSDGRLAQKTEIGTPSLGAGLCMCVVFVIPVCV